MVVGGATPVNARRAVGHWGPATRSTWNGYPLQAHELQLVGLPVLDFKAELDGLTDTLHELVE